MIHNIRILILISNSDQDYIYNSSVVSLVSYMVYFLPMEHQPIVLGRLNSRLPRCKAGNGRNWNVPHSFFASDLPFTSDEIPVTSDEIPVTSDEIPVASMYIPSIPVIYMYTVYTSIRMSILSPEFALQVVPTLPRTATRLRGVVWCSLIC